MFDLNKSVRPIKLPTFWCLMYDVTAAMFKVTSDRLRGVHGLGAVAGTMTQG